MITDVLTVLAGKASWPVAEYLIHRFYEHNPFEEGGGAAYHVHHHRHPEGYNDTNLLKVIEDFQDQLIPATAVVLLGLAPVFGLKRTLLFSGGLLWGLKEYGDYHLQAHQSGPENEEDERLMKHHLAHHFRTPNANFGVTTDLYDKLFGTFKEVDVVPVPAHMAPKWLQENPDQWAKDYKIVGKRKAG